MKILGSKFYFRVHVVMLSILSCHVLCWPDEIDPPVRGRPGTGRTVAATSVSTPLVESLAAAAGSQCSGGGSAAEDHMSRLRGAYSLFLTTSGMLVNMCKKKLGIDEDEDGIGDADGCREDAADATKE